MSITEAELAAKLKVFLPEFVSLATMLLSRDQSSESNTDVATKIIMIASPETLLDENNNVISYSETELLAGILSCLAPLFEQKNTINYFYNDFRHIVGTRLDPTAHPDELEVVDAYGNTQQQSFSLISLAKGILKELGKKTDGSVTNE